MPSLSSPLGLIREYLTPVGLFTNGSETESWGLAHRILLPAFSMKGMKEYFPTLIRQGYRLMAQLDRMCQAGDAVDVPDLMTRYVI